MYIERARIFSGGFLLIGQTYAEQGKYRQAIEELTKARNLQGGYILASSELGYIYATSGERAEAQKILADLQQRAKREYVNPYFIAIIHVGLGEPERAFALLNQAIDTRSGSMLPVSIEPKFAPLRSDPRFNDLLRHMGFPQ
jgi:adenylate cyclase